MDWPRPVMPESSASFQLAKSPGSQRFALTEKALYNATGYGELVTAMPESKSSNALVAIIMGSKSDWETMRHSVEMLDELGVPNESHVLSAHRTPDATAEFARKAADRGLRVIIAGAGGAAHLAGVIAAYTWLPVLGVPIQSQALQGLDSLLSIAQMPGGIPVGTLAIGKCRREERRVARRQHYRTQRREGSRKPSGVSKEADRRGARAARSMTQVLPSRTPEERAKAVASAAELLRSGDTVALPTETVYGLAADALKSEAVVKDFRSEGATALRSADRSSARSRMARTGRQNRR